MLGGRNLRGLKSPKVEPRWNIGIGEKFGDIEIGNIGDWVIGVVGRLRFRKLVCWLLEGSVRSLLQENE